MASNRTLSWRWIFALCVLDAALIPACAALGGGFSHYFFHPLYYPLLAGFAAFFTSVNVGLASLNLPREFSARLEYLQLISEEMLPHFQ